MPERWLPARTADPPRWRLAMLAAAGVLIGIAVAVGFALSGSPAEPEVPPALPAASVSEVRTPAGATAPAADSSIVISVVGRVTTPGLVTLPGGSRVADALEAAGGPVPGANLGNLNLARRLGDGEQIYVGVPAPPGAEVAAAAPADGQPGAAARVDLNTATLATLDTLPGVGPVTAQRILDWRTQHGRFASVEQLREIEGIGPTRFSRLKDLVVAG
ncbi:ComEA family DNA-binding protein [Actinophytocola sediminis]